MPTEYRTDAAKISVNVGQPTSSTKTYDTPALKAQVTVSQPNRSGSNRHRSASFSTEQTVETTPLLTQAPPKTNTSEPVATMTNKKTGVTTPVPENKKSFNPQESPYSPLYVPAGQEKSYQVMADTQIKTFTDSKGNVVAVEDPVAKQSYAVQSTEQAEAIQTYYNRKREELVQEIVARPQQSVYSKVDKPKGIFETMQDTALRLDFQAQNSSGFERQLASAGAFGLGVVSGFTAPIFKPAETVKGTIEFGKNVVTQPFETGSQLFGEFSVSPAKFSGEVVGGVLFGEALGKGVGKATDIGKDVFVKAGSKYVEPTEVFAESVLQGKERMPMTSSVEESLLRFGRAKKGENIVVSTAAPSPLSDIVAGVGKKAGMGLEDPGIYVTPKGEGSPYFTGLKGETPYPELTLNPFKPISERLQVPTVTEFEVSGVSRLPREVVSKPGFSGVEQFFDSLKGNTEAFITKRSEVGLGEIPTQRYPTSTPVKIKGRTYQVGEYISEPGTTELEAVIPKGTSFEYAPNSFMSRIKGYDKYTLYEGRPVAIREATVISKGGEVLSRPIKANKVFDYEKIASESSMLYGRQKSSSVIGSVKYVSGLSMSSLKTSVPSSSIRNVQVSSSYKPSSVKSSPISGKSSVISSISSSSKSSSSSSLSSSKSSILRSSSSSIRSSSSSSSTFGLSSSGGSSGSSGLSSIMKSSSSRSKSSFASSSVSSLPKSSVAFMFEPPKPKEEKKKSKKRGKILNIPTPSIEAQVFNIRGKYNTRLASTGLAIRPLSK